MQHPSHNGKIQGFFNFGQPHPNPTPMTVCPVGQDDTPPQPTPLFNNQPQTPQLLPSQTSQQPQQPQPMRGSCMGATGPMQNKGFESGLGNSMSILKKEKENKEVIASLYTELSSIRTQIETLTKATDNIYKIISKFNC
jgi:hypothetical protein